MQYYSFNTFKKLYQIKQLTCERILQNSLQCINTQSLLSFEYTTLYYKTLPNFKMKIKNLYMQCTELFFVKTCTTCQTKHTPQQDFCMHCGDLLNIKHKCNIDLGE